MAGKADVYFNLHKRLFSVKMDGRVVRHCGYAFMRDVRFVVQPAGRQRVLDEGRKNVHAFVRGTLAQTLGIKVEGAGFKAVRYNPYEAGHFMLLDGTPVHTASWVYLDKTNDKPEIFAWGIK